MPKETCERIGSDQAGNGYSLLTHICNGCLLAHDPKRTGVLVVSSYLTYLDASGHPSDKRFICVAGFIATEEKWNKFAGEWRKCLKSNGIDFPFHAVDFFRKFKNHKRFKHIQGDLVRVIANYVLAGFSAAVEIEAYKEANRYYRLEEILGTPYALATKNVYDNFHSWKKTVGFSDPNLFFAERGTLHEGDMREVLEDRDGFDAPTPVKKELEPCQAADLFAYAMYQFWCTEKVSDLLTFFDLKLKTPRERLDTVMYAEHFEDYITNRKITGFFGDKNTEIRVATPSREESLAATIRFAGNKNRSRIRRVKD